MTSAIVIWLTVCVHGMFWSPITVFLSVQICSMRNKSKTEGKEGKKKKTKEKNGYNHSSKSPLKAKQSLEHQSHKIAFQHAIFLRANT